MTTMHNPPHPGEFIQAIYLAPHHLSLRFIAKKMGVAHTTFSRLLHGKTHLSPEMALRISKVLGRSPESWLQMQNNYDLWVAKKRVNTNLLDSILFSSLNHQRAA